MYLLSYLLPTSKIKLRPLRRLLTQHKISFSLQDNLSSLRQKLKAFIKTLEKGKCREEKQAVQLAMEIETREQSEARHHKIYESWSQFDFQCIQVCTFQFFF